MNKSFFIFVVLLLISIVGCAPEMKESLPSNELQTAEEPTPKEVAPAEHIFESQKLPASLPKHRQAKCYDVDGKNIFERADIVVDGNKYTDGCADFYNVSEAICNERDMVDFVTRTCPEGLQCKDGVCRADIVTEFKSWAVVFTYIDTPLPQEKIEWHCESSSTNALPFVAQWFKKEAEKYNVINDVSPTLSCFEAQIQLTGKAVVNGSEVNDEGSSFRLPINIEETVSLLETENPALSTYDAVTVFYYTSQDVPVLNFAWNKPYTFRSVKLPILYGFDDEWSSKSTAHEILHLFGATDKYGGAESACLVDPATGKEYLEFDVMCARIEHKETGFYAVPLEQLIVSEPTAHEIRWKK